MNTKQIRMLELLCDKIQSCTECSLYKNGRCKPYWNEKFKGYLLIGEAPGYNEIKTNDPFVGDAGDKLWKMLCIFDIVKEECAVINTVNCRPVNGTRNGKPTKNQIAQCRQWIRKYIKVLQPSKILILGAYAMNNMTDITGGILINNNTLYNGTEFNIPMIISVHPAYSIYNRKEGSEMLYKSIKKFKQL